MMSDLVDVDISPKYGMVPFLLYDNLVYVF